MCCLCVSTHGQLSTPLADRVDEALVPAGVSELPVTIGAELAYLFRDEDGVDAVHLVGDSVLTLGGQEAQALRARQAVVWMERREFDGRPFQHLQVFLWRNAEVSELGGTVTSGPTLFVTLNTFGEVSTSADDVAFESSADTPVYREGDVIRKALATPRLRDLRDEVSLRVFDASGLGIEKDRPVTRPVILFRTEGEIMGPVAYDGHRVLTVIGGVYLSRGTPNAGSYLEIRADSVVVFLSSADEASPGESPAAAGLGGDGQERSSGSSAGKARRQSRERREESDRQLMSTGFGDVEVEAVYLEGDIIMSQGPSTVRASRLYYDFLEERALILDAVVRTTMIERNLPLYMRAAEIRQLSAKQFSARDAALTTSEFHTPHYHIGAARVDLTNLTPATSTAGQPGIRAGSFRVRHATLSLSGKPIAYWPSIRGNVDTSETAVKSVRTGFSDDFGVELETEWHLFNVLGLKTPDGFDSVMSLDYFSKRGPAAGVDVDYKRDRYFGEITSYLLSDNDEDFLGRERETPSPKDLRGRALWRHKQYFESDWQASLEFSYISDRGFLEEFFESEFDNEKEQETLLHLKKQRDNWAFTGLLQTRLMDFTTATERLPDAGFFVVGQPLGDHASWFSENRAGVVRYRPADKSFLELIRDGKSISSGSVLRGDTRQEVNWPLTVGALRIVPFVTGRVTSWDDSPGSGGLTRGFGTLGVRSSMYLSRVFADARSSLFDVDGVRHIIKPDFTAWVTEANHAANDLFPFDDTVEGIDEADGVTVGLRQRWQTKRGRDDTRRIVDFLTLDLEAGFFNDADGEARTNGYTSFSRPENSITHNYINSSLIWRVNDRTALLSELNYDINDGGIDVLNVSLAVERTPRLSYLLGYRFIEKSHSDLLGFDMNYRLTEKYTVALRERFDLDRGRTLDFTVAFIRKMPRWFGAISFDLDEAEDDFGVSLSLWPEGLPQAGLGSRRFTGLANTTRIVRD
ncbi:MAG: LPS assembly protein LptD [Phycisphaerales bacterium]|nr:MAG: LPS assembly protein LptD [Phycisphaerales bacterium]